jgi:hypothetical protein
MTYIKIFFFKNIYSIEIKKVFEFDLNFLDSHQFLGKNCIMRYTGFFTNIIFCVK